MANFKKGRRWGPGGRKGAETIPWSLWNSVFQDNDVVSSFRRRLFFPDFGTNTQLLNIILSDFSSDCRFVRVLPGWYFQQM